MGRALSFLECLEPLPLLLLLLGLELVCPARHREQERRGPGILDGPLDPPERNHPLELHRSRLGVQAPVAGGEGERPLRLRQEAPVFAHYAAVDDALALVQQRTPESLPRPPPLDAPSLQL